MQVKPASDQMQTTLSVVVRTSARSDFPPDVVRLLEVLAQIEQRRQARLRSLRRKEAS